MLALPVHVSACNLFCYINKIYFYHLQISITKTPKQNSENLDIAVLAKDYLSEMDAHDMNLWFAKENQTKKSLSLLSQ